VELTVFYTASQTIFYKMSEKYYEPGCMNIQPGFETVRFGFDFPQ
jgi:hypothetical protein